MDALNSRDKEKSEGGKQQAAKVMGGRNNNLF